MIHDVIHSQYKMSKCCANVALSNVLKECKKTVNKDLTAIKPIDAMALIQVPCFFMVGKDDIIARPEKVRDLFVNTDSKRKEYHLFDGDHSSHRHKSIVKKAILFIFDEFDSFPHRVSELL